MLRPYWWFVIQVMCLSFLNCFVECVDDPLILTPYLKMGNIKEAQEKALVTPNMNGVISYSGFFTVDEECGNNLFFWFFPAENNWETAPVLLWASSGSPGYSSIFGMFIEVGPFNYYKKDGFVNNKYSWTKDNNVIFLDQPVGVGFSFSEKECFADNLTAVAQDSYSALQQFFTLFPNLQQNRFFLTGQAYATHYLLAIGSEIDRRNEDASLKINMIGYFIGNPDLDARCWRTAAFLYELGVIDEKSRDKLARFESDLYKLIDDKNYTGAISMTYHFDDGLPNYYNVLYDQMEWYEYQLHIRRYDIRKQIHVGNTPYIVFSVDVCIHLTLDVYMPVTHYLQEALNTDKYIMGFYSGQLDMNSRYTSLPCVLRPVEWHGSAEYLQASRSQWWVDGRLAGWFKTAGNLFEIAVRNSGSYVPLDQGRAALVLLTAATAETPGSQLLTKLQTKP